MEVTSSMAQTEALRPLRHHSLVWSTWENCSMSELGNPQAQPKAPLGTPALLQLGQHPGHPEPSLDLQLPEPFVGAAAQHCHHCPKERQPYPGCSCSPGSPSSRSRALSSSTATSVLRAAPAAEGPGLSSQLAPCPPNRCSSYSRA